MGSFDGKPIVGCLVDTGSQCNVLSQRDAGYMGLKWEKGSSVQLTGFNNTDAKVVGEWNGRFNFGPNFTQVYTKFIIVEHDMAPIIGMPTLREFDYSINCGEQALECNKTHQKLRCSMVNNGESLN